MTARSVYGGTISVKQYSPAFHGPAVSLNADSSSGGKHVGLILNLAQAQKLRDELDAAIEEATPKTKTQYRQVFTPPPASIWCDGTPWALSGWHERGVQWHIETREVPA